MGPIDLASALTIDYHTSLCFYGHPDSAVQYSTAFKGILLQL